MKELKLAWRYVRRHWWQYILGILALFIVDEVNTYVPRFTGEITNGLDQHTLDMGGVMGLVWKIVLIGVIIAVGRFAWRFFLFGSARSIEKELRSDLFAHLSSLSPHYYNEHKTGDLMTRFTSDLNAIRMAIGPAVICVFDASVMTIMVIFQMMYYVSVKLTLIAVIPMLFILFGEIYYGKIIRPRFTARQEAVFVWGVAKGGGPPDPFGAGKGFRYPRHQGFCPRKSTALSLFKRKRKHDGKELKHCKDPVHCHSTVRCHHRSFFTAYFNLWRLSRTDR